MTTQPSPAPAPAMQGERKTVTVLFTDVVGSTTLAEQLDPEEWADLVNGMHQRVSAAVAKYDGLVAQLLGDGALAFFGAPAAHEDDPERAVLAALDILAAIKDYAKELKRAGRVSDFRMRVGLNTGLVVVGMVGAGGKFEYLAVGDTVNLAARMQSAAEPNGILITEATARAVRHAFDLDFRGELEVKGKSALVPAYAVVGLKAAPEPKRGIVGLDSPIVGREREIAQLRECLSGLVRGQGRIVSIMGDAGLGKSRLVAEIIQRAPEDFDRIEARCASFGVSTPYAPLIDAIRRTFFIHTGDDDATQMAKLRAGIPDEAHDGLPFIAAVMGLQLSGDDLDRVRYLEPPQLRVKVIGALSSALEASAVHHKPIALIVEDLHWSDSSSLDVLEHLMPAATRAPLLLVAAFRPQKEEPSWRFHEAAQREFAANYTPIQLQPLDERESRELVANLLRIEGLPETVRQLILSKAEGNPFYVEEVIRTLLDAKLVVRDGEYWRATREIAAIALPDTLAGVIMARLDRLDEHSKRAAQEAAVIGREFAFDLLWQISDAKPSLEDAMLTLQDRELIRAKSNGARAYGFKHALTQEAAYGSLLLSQRRALHRRSAEALEQSDKTRVAEISRHFIEAQQPLRALPYLIESGERALGAYSMPEAISAFSGAVEIANTQDLDAVDAGLARRAYEGLGGAYTMTYDVQNALKTYEAMEKAGQARNNAPMRVSAMNKSSYILSMFTGQFDAAGAALDSAERLARDCDDQAGLAEGLVMRCNVSTFRADFEDGVKHLDTLVQVGRKLNRDFETAFGLVHSANSWTYLARFDKAWPAAQEARDFAESHGDLTHLAETLAFSYAFGQLSFGEVGAAYASAEQGTQIALRIGNLYAGTMGSLVAGSIARWQGDAYLAMAHFERGLGAAKAMGLPFAVAMLLAAMCGTLVEQDTANFEATREMHEQVAQLLAHPMGTVAGGSAWADLGECALALGKYDAAREHFQKGLTVPTAHKHLNRPRLLAGMARVELAEGRVEEAAALVAEAREYAEAHKMMWTYPMVTLAEADVKAAPSRDSGAAECYRSAEAQAEAMGMRTVARQAAAGAARLAVGVAREQAE